MLHHTSWKEHGCRQHFKLVLLVTVAKRVNWTSLTPFGTYAWSLCSKTPRMNAKLAFRTLHTIPQQISAPSIPHFTFRVPQFRILPGPDITQNWVGTSTGRRREYDSNMIRSPIWPSLSLLRHLMVTLWLFVYYVSIKQAYTLSFSNTGTFCTTDLSKNGVTGRETRHQYITATSTHAKLCTSLVTASRADTSSLQRTTD